MRLIYNLNMCKQMLRVCAIINVEGDLVSAVAIIIFSPSKQCWRGDMVGTVKSALKARPPSISTSNIGWQYWVRKGQGLKSLRWIKTRQRIGRIESLRVWRLRVEPKTLLIYGEPFAIVCSLKSTLHKDAHALQNQDKTSFEYEE